MLTYKLLRILNLVQDCPQSCNGYSIHPLRRHKWRYSPEREVGPCNGLRSRSHSCRQHQESGTGFCYTEFMSFQAVMIVLLQNGLTSFLFLSSLLFFFNILKWLSFVWVSESSSCCSATSSCTHRKFRETVYDASHIVTKQLIIFKKCKEWWSYQNHIVLYEHCNHSVSISTTFYSLLNWPHVPVPCSEKELPRCYGEINCSTKYCFQNHLHKWTTAFSLVGWHFQLRNKRSYLVRDSRRLKKVKRKQAHGHLKQKCKSRAEEGWDGLRYTQMYTTANGILWHTQWLLLIFFTGLLAAWRLSEVQGWWVAETGSIRVDQIAPGSLG